MSPVSHHLAGALLRVKLARSAPPLLDAAPRMPLPPDRIKIGAVQWDVSPVQRAEDWTRRLESIFQLAHDTHCHLLVFPEYMPVSLLGTIVPEGTGAHTLTDATVRALLRALGPITYRFWLRWMTALSRHYGLVTVAGSGLVVRQGRLLNEAVVVGPDGAVWSRQAKLHLMADEARWGIQPGDGPLSDPVAPWGLMPLVCNDATYFESFRMAAHKDTQIVAVPIADPDARYTVGKARRGCFSQVQDVPMVGVVGAATGRLFGLRLTGRAGIYLPAPLTADGSGVAAESLQAVGEGLTTAVVSLTRLRSYQGEHRARHPIPPADFMESLYHLEEDR